MRSAAFSFNKLHKRKYIGSTSTPFIRDAWHCTNNVLGKKIVDKKNGAILINSSSIHTVIKRR